MTAQILDGKAISARVLEAVRLRIEQRVARGLRPPCLAVILVGADPASAIYVRNKRKACETVGVRSISHDLPSDISQDDLLKIIRQLNDDDAVDGILVQAPLPAHISDDIIIEHIDPAKDVDGFHPYNIGRLAVRKPALRSCTPYGVMRLLEATGLSVRGMNAVVVGVSNHVGRPMALELLLAGCTVTSCHRFTRNLAEEVARADIVVAAAGKPGLVKGEWIRPGAIVIDIGISRLESGKICGDVEFEAASERAAWITPVPGGVGPMTVAMLMQNTLDALEHCEAGE